MDWRPIDFHGIIGLDRSIVDQIDEYLQEKETRLAHQIFDSIQPSSEGEEGSKPALIFATGVHLKLSDAVEGLTKKIRTMNRKQLMENIGQKGDGLIKELNSVLWEFTEVLEGCVMELFQQIKQVSVDKWHRSLSQVVTAIKDILVHYIDDLIWVIRRLEGPLKEYIEKLGVVRNSWFEWFRREKKTELDPAILDHLIQSEHYLKSQYSAFHDRYADYMRFSMKIENDLDKMKTYPILALLDVEDQNTYIDIFRLLKLRELNQRPRSTLALETNRSLKQLCSIYCAIKLFRTYYRGLKDAFFNSSLELKSLDEEEVDRLSKLKDKVRDYHQELNHLLVTMTKYREFILQTNANPYVRSRWGFTEHPVAPEPAKARSLLNLIYSTEELKEWYARFLESLSKESLLQQRKEVEMHQEIDRILHEMGQPLISQSMLRNRASHLLDYIRECDEIGSSHFETVYYMEDVFSKAIRADWKYHVLHESPLFHELYHIHQGLQMPVEDPAHAFRIERFFRLFDQIEDWVRKGDAYAHVHEIELDINDMKTYLQDFLATIQRASREKSSDPFLDETVEKFRRQLLEYRYIFGQFFLNITTKNSEGQQLRNQFLFVDQYFESIENLLNDMKATWEGK